MIVSKSAEDVSLSKKKVSISLVASPQHAGEPRRMVAARVQARLSEEFADLPDKVRSYLTLESDDVNYNVSKFLPVSDKLAIPLVYDFHHHRCNQDGLFVEGAILNHMRII